MSRVGKQPISVPSGVNATVAAGLVTIAGPKGKLTRKVRPEVQVKIEGGLIQVECHREDAKAYHGTERALLNNMVKGVSQGFVRELELVGVGYRAEQRGNVLDLGLGYSHPIEFAVPKGVDATVVKDGRQIFIRLEGADKQQVGQVAAKLRALREPEPYKGKGVRYKDEVIKLKAGKTSKK